MEILIGIKNDLRRLGILEFDHPYSKFISFAQFCLVVGFICVDFSTPLWFFIFDAQTFIQRVESSMPISAGFLSLTAYCTLSWQREKILKLITEYESMIAQRKS